MALWTMWTTSCRQGRRSRFALRAPLGAVEGLVFRSWGLGFSVWDLGFRVKDSGFRA